MDTDPNHTETPISGHRLRPIQTATHPDGAYGVASLSVSDGCEQGIISSFYTSPCPLSRPKRDLVPHAFSFSSQAALLSSR